MSFPPQASVTPRYTRTERGTPVAALFYSLIESAKLAGGLPLLGPGVVAGLGSVRCWCTPAAWVYNPESDAIERNTPERLT